MGKKNGDILIDVKDLSKWYPLEAGVFQRGKSFVHAVSGIDLQIHRGESVGLVGESGCGKTTIGKILTRLIDPSRGSVILYTEKGPVDIANLRGGEMRTFRRRVQMIFQDPYESMNPRLPIYDTVAEPLDVQGIGTVAEREGRVTELLEMVGLTPASSYLFRYPHELSGGQRQRIAIARALVINPDFVVADEPTSMLDVSVRTGVMHLMQDLADSLGVTYLYITHDLAVARHMCTRIGVMYLGKIVEFGETDEVLNHPKHPYTRALLSAVPVPDPRFNRQSVNIEGTLSKPVDPAPRCRFYDRCIWRDRVCERNEHPPLEDTGFEHYAACYHIDRIEAEAGKSISLNL